MNKCDRFRMILAENQMKQKQLAAEIGITESYVSKLLKDPDIRLSQSLASLIEAKLGYSAEWILEGSGPKRKQTVSSGTLTELHRQALARLEEMNSGQVKAVLAFIRSLDEIEKSFPTGGRGPQ